RAPWRDASGAVRGTVDILMDITERKRVEKALRESEERFRLIAETITEVFWISDPSISKMFYISPGYEHVWGRSLESLRENPRSFIEAIHHEDRERVTTDLIVQKEGKPFDHEYRIIRPDGSIRWIWDRGYPVRDEAGTVTRYVGVAHDITARKLAEQSLRKLSQGMAQTADSILVTDKNGVIEFVNPGFTHLTGFTQEEAIGQTPRILKSGNQSIDFYQKMWATILDGEVFRDTFVNRKKTGELFYEEKTIAPVKDEQGSITNFVAVGRDITLRRQAEEELKNAKEAAEDANRAKSDFLANMSHEIRTPMNGIIGMTELALETELTPTQKEYLDMVKSSADTLLRVINDILDFSRVEAGKLELECEPFALRASIGETMKLLGHLAHRKNLELAWQTSVDVPEWLVGDCGRLRQMLVNLVGNAIKFTERGEVVVSIGLESSAKDSVDLHFRVTDTGIGIPADKQELIFGAFTQADGSTTRKYGGTGLGLAITQRLALLQGGRLWVESKLGKGSAFHFTLRLGLPDGDLASLSTPDADALRDLRVLVVDDNQTNRQILVQLVKNWRMVPQEAEGGKQALQLLERAQSEGNPFHIAILDAQMPEMDGFSLARRIHEDSRFSATSAIMLSSSARPEETSQLHDFGISAYLIKPAEPSELLDAISNTVAKGASLPPSLPPSSSPEIIHHASSGLKILLAEDNAVNRQLATRLLEKRGHAVVAVNDGRQALDAVEREKFHLVLMDVQMPEMDGLEATRVIRKKEKSTGEHLPVIAVTAHVMKGDREKCLEAGSDDYVSKPIQAAELYSAIDRVQKPAHDSHTSSAGPEATSSVPPFVPEDLLEHFQGDRDLLAEIIRLFRDEAASLLRSLREAVQNRDASAISRTSHTLKGSIGNFGSGPAFQASKKMDEIARTGDAAGAGALLPQLEFEIERLQTALESFSGAAVK
ncbi:MAG TPA: response regulator, partial [Candidatus Acidoferrales bacterium]|nr:response regulator [Candidatus Acidoferrales bacterium]